MKVPFLDLKAQYETIKDEVNAATQRVYESQQFILGPEVEELEKQIAIYCGTKYAVGVSSGTDALLVSLMAMGIGPGDEVITTPYTFRATVSSIVRVGAWPVFVDIEEDTYNIDARAIGDKITDRTKAIMPVHLFGQCCDMDTIREYGLPIIEDACQAIGAEYRDGRTGSLGDMGCFSFFPSKNLGGYGDGGMIVTSNEALYEKAKNLRTQAGNFRLDELQAAILLTKLPHLDRWTKVRRTNATVYRATLGELTIGLPKEIGDRHVYNQFVISLPMVTPDRRNELREFLASKGIETKVYYPNPMFPLPEAHWASKTTLALPIYPELITGQLTHVALKIREFYG